jgi:hypothetical protein
MGKNARIGFHAASEGNSLEVSSFPEPRELVKVQAIGGRACACV